MKKDRIKFTDDDIQALINGDEEILHNIFLALQPKIYRFLWYKTKSVEVTEDLVQETFLRLWGNKTHLKKGHNLQTYLFRIASNLATDYLRKTERHKELHPQFDTNENPSTADETAEYNQLLQIIDNIVSSLSNGPQTAFILSRYEQLSHKEIAETMEISVKTVEKHIGKALQVLKTEIGKHDIALPF